jgi:hypothetical protein
MASIITATTTSGLTQSADNSGVLQLASGTGNLVTVPSVTGTAMVSGNMPAFSAYAGSSTSLPNATWTKITFDTESFDTNSNFASSRFTPTVAGYYQLNASWQSGATTSFAGTAFYKNGTLWQYGTFTPATSVGTQAGASALIYFNGSTDYVEVYAYQATGSTGTTTASNSGTTWFSGSMIRSA